MEAHIDCCNGKAIRFTAGQVARMLGVDLKTVHKWVSRGKLRGVRTKGGHRRFLPIEVVRFLRHSGRPIPPELILDRVVVLGVGVPAAALAGLEGEAYEFYDGLLALSASAHDVVIIGLDGVTKTAVAGLVQAIRRRPSTSGMGLIGVTSIVEHATEFVAAGGDSVVTSIEEIVQALRVLTGHVEEPQHRRVVHESGFFTAVTAGTVEALEPSSAPQQTPWICAS